MSSSSRVYDRKPVADTEQKLDLTRLGSYTIVRKLARGGMAELFLARSVGPEGFEKLVVIKKILPRYAEHPRFVQLFLDEAKLAASFDHPNIVQVYDMGRVDGHYFFAMEYVHGQDLRGILRRSDRTHQLTPIEYVVQISRALASALHHAHERRRPDGTLRDIVHRDVSPSNVLVSYDGAIKLADFGVAKATTSTQRTRTGTLKGKVGYMSPEQARGLTIDRRSDIFSLGVVMYELVAVRRLFKTDNDLATIQSIINNPPPPLMRHRSDCPPELEQIINKALEKEPATRFQTAQEVQQALEELAREHKLNQSPIALSRYVSGLFEAEIAAWRDALQAGSTVTEFLVASGGPSTPVSESGLDVPFAPSGDEVDEDEEELDPDLDEEDEKSEQTAGPPVPVLSGSIHTDAEIEEATAIAPPPIMPDLVDTPPPPVPKLPPAKPAEADIRADSTPTRPAPAAPSPTPAPPIVPAAPVVPADQIFEAIETTVSPSPFRDEASTTVDVKHFGAEPGMGQRQPQESQAVTTVGAPRLPTPAAGVVVGPQTPPIGIPAMTTYPVLVTGSQQQMSAWENDSLTPQRRRLVIFGVVTAALIIIVVIIAIIAGGGESAKDAPADEPASEKN